LITFVPVYYTFATAKRNFDRELKKFSTIILLTIIILQTFGSFVIQVDYFLNKSYIAKVFCINREKPKMHCNGKCYLAKQLKEQEQQEQQAPNLKREKFEVQPCYLPTSFAFTAIAFTNNIEYYYTSKVLTSPFLRSIFHPPNI
jgi:hypothetical protein